MSGRANVREISCSHRTWNDGMCSSAKKLRNDNNDDERNLKRGNLTGR
jgi:hypothetical protein